MFSCLQQSTKQQFGVSVSGPVDEYFRHKKENHLQSTQQTDADVEASSADLQLTFVDERLLQTSRTNDQLFYL